MKKLLFFLFFISLFACPAMAAYSVDSVTTSAEVSTTGEAEVSTVVQLTFTEGESSVTIPLPDGDLSHIDSSASRYKVRRTDDGVDLVFTAGGQGFVGSQTYVITYTVAAPADSSEESDEYSLELLSPRWGLDIGSFSYQVTMAGSNVPLEEGFRLAPQIVSGYYGPLSEYDAGLTINGTIFSGTITDLMAYESMGLQISLPEGYFYVKPDLIPVIAITWLSVGMLIVLALCLVYWRRTLYTRPVEAVSRALTPEGILPCQLPLALDGKTCDVAALILEWANLGYLAIRRSRNGTLVLVQGIPMGTERSKAERTLYRNIFASNRMVAMTPGRCSAAANKFRASARRSLARMCFDRKSGNPALVQLLCRLMTAVGIGFMFYRLFPDGAGFLVIAIILSFPGLLYAIRLHDALSDWVVLRIYSIRTFVPVALMPVLLVFGLLAGAFPEVSIGLLATVLSALLTGSGPRRDERGRDLMAQVRGCRIFYHTVEWSQLQLLLGQSNRFFQRQLPNATALRCDKAFARRFERLAVPCPEWLPDKRRTSFTAVSLQREIALIMRDLRRALE